MTDQPIDRRIADQTTKNLGLARRFLAEVLEDESILDSIPAELPIILAPAEEDDELRAMNLELSIQQMAEGRNNRFQLVGKRPLGSESWRPAEISGLTVRSVSPHFPESMPDPQGVKVIYDQGRDALMVDFYAGQRVGVSLPASEYVALRVDPESSEIVGYLVVSFLQVSAGNSPILARALRKATFREITPEELGAFAVQITGSSSSAFDDQEAAAVMREVRRLIA